MVRGHRAMCIEEARTRGACDGKERSDKQPEGGTCLKAPCERLTAIGMSEIAARRPYRGRKLEGCTSGAIRHSCFPDPAAAEAFRYGQPAQASGG